MSLNGYTDFSETPLAFNADAALLVRFEEKLVKNEFRSELAGKAEYDLKEYIEIPLPGGKSIFCDEVSDEHRERFHVQYKKWRDSIEKGVSRPVEGTPLENLTILDRRQVMTAEMANLYTIEPLAIAPDTTIQELGIGWAKYRDHAKAYLEAAKSTSVATKFVQELEKRDDEIEMLKQQVADLSRGKK